MITKFEHLFNDEDSDFEKLGDFVLLANMEYCTVSQKRVVFKGKGTFTLDNGMEFNYSGESLECDSYRVFVSSDALIKRVGVYNDRVSMLSLLVSNHFRFLSLRDSIADEDLVIITGIYKKYLGGV